MSEYKIRILTPEQALELFATKGELSAVVAGENGGGGVAVWGSVIGVLSAQTDLQTALNQKQFILTPGAGVDIDYTDPDNPVISVVGGEGAAWGDITGVIAEQTDLQAILAGKQAILTVGTGITIDNTDPAHPIISASGVGGPVPLDAKNNAIINTGTGYTLPATDPNALYGLTLVGRNASARADYVTALGNNAGGSAYEAVAIGDGSSATGGDSAAIGSSADAQGSQSVALGQYAVASGDRSLAGPDSDVAAPDSFGFRNQNVVGHRERAVFGVRDLQVIRATGSSRDPFGDYSATGPQTGIILSDSAGARWRVTVSTAGVLTATADNSPTSPVGWVFQSTAGSFQNWTSINCSSNGQYAIATRYSGNIYTTSNYGTTWTARTAAGSRSWGDCVISADGQSMMASYPGGAYKSTNAGGTWTAVTIPAVSGATWTSLSANSTLTSIILSNGSQIYKSTDMGVSWANIYSTWTDNTWTITAMSGDGNVIYAANRGGGFNQYVNAIQSIDGGTTFTTMAQMPYCHGNVNSISTSHTGEYSLWPSAFGPMYYSTDIGDEFYEVDGLRGGTWSATATSSSGQFAIAVDSSSGGLYFTDDMIYELAYVNASVGTSISGWKHCCISSDGGWAYAIDGNGINGYDIP